jgi:hypothetical protein
VTSSRKTSPAGINGLPLLSTPGSTTLAVACHVLSIPSSWSILSPIRLAWHEWTDHLFACLLHTTNSNSLPDPVPEPPVVYKKSIIFFRSLFAYMRLLPAYQLYRRLKKQNHPLRIGFRVSRGQSPEESMFRESEIGIGKNSVSKGCAMRFGVHERRQQQGDVYFYFSWASKWQFM